MSTTIMPATIQTNLHLDPDQFAEAKQILSQLGMSFGEAVNIFINLIVVKHGLPFNVDVLIKKDLIKLEEYDKLIPLDKVLRAFSEANYSEEFLKDIKNGFETSTLKEKFMRLSDETVPTRKHKPSPMLFGSVKIQGDLISPAIPETDWDALK